MTDDNSNIKEKLNNNNIDTKEDVIDIINEYINNLDSEPRSKDRIYILIVELLNYWDDNPELRLGQIISNISNKRGFGDDPFYMEDETIIDYLHEHNNKCTKK